MFKSLLVLLNTSNDLIIGDAGCVDLTPTGDVDMSGASSIAGKTDSCVCYAPDEMSLPAVGGATQQEPWTDIETLQFVKSATKKATIAFSVPSDIDVSQGMDILYTWAIDTADTGAKAIKWDAVYAFIDISGGALPPGAYSTLTQTVGEPTPDQLQQTTIGTTSTPTAGYMLHLIVQRDGADVADDFLQDAQLLQVIIKYKRKL